jgi:hypothetical protein
MHNLKLLNWNKEMFPYIRPKTTLGGELAFHLQGLCALKRVIWWPVCEDVVNCRTGVAIPNDLPGQVLGQHLLEGKVM